MLRIWWQVWRDSPAFSNLVKEIIHEELNSDRPKFLSELTTGALKIKGPAPILFDLENISSFLSPDPHTQAYIDTSFMVQGPIETTLFTKVCLTWPKEIEFEVQAKVTVESFVGKARLMFTS